LADNEPIDVLMTIAFDDTLMAWLRGVSPRLNIKMVKANKTEEIPSDIWATAEVLYTNRVVPDPELAPNLRWIQFHWAGINHAAEASILKKAGVVATTLSGAASTQMAEYILMMLLALGHRLPDLLEHQRRAIWPKDRWERFDPLELRDSTVGLIGYGSIARQAARLLIPFKARVLAVKRDGFHPQDPGYFEEGFGDLEGDYVHRLYPTQALHSMVKECDYIVVTTPLTLATFHLVDAEMLAAMKPTAFLINPSRGDIVDEEALITALREKKLAGAALDVFHDEPLPPDNPLWKMSNVTITPHISGITPHYDERAVELFAENLKRYLSGQDLYNRFDPLLGY